MAPFDIATADAAAPNENWIHSDLDEERDPLLGRARQRAHQALVATARDLARSRDHARQVLLEAHVEAEVIRAHARDERQALLGAARAEAGAILDAADAEAAARQRSVLANAEEQAGRILDRALDHREEVIVETVARIVELSGGLVAVAERIIARAEDPSADRSELAKVMVLLTDAAGRIEAEAA